MKNFKFLAVGLLAVILGACGGGSGGNITGDPNAGVDAPSAAAAGLAIIANPGTLQSASDVPVEITAIVTDELSGAVNGAQVLFTAGPNAFLSSSTAVSDEFGLAKVNLTTIDPTNRTITVGAALVDGTTVALDVEVVGTALDLTGPVALGLGETASFTVFLRDSNGAAQSGRIVDLLSANGNTLPATVTTGADGRATFDVTADVGGADLLTATALGASGNQDLTVSNDSFAIISPAPGDEINLGQVVNFTVEWIQNGVPQVGQTVNFATGRGTLSSNTGVTNGAGQATVTLSSTSAGVSELAVFDPVTLAGNSIDVEFVATTPSLMVLTPSFENLVPGQTTDLEARIEDADGNAVKNQQIQFSLLADDTNGDLSPLVATTDSNGIARSFYTAGPNSSGTDSVTVQAVVVATPGVNDTANLTVAGQAFSFDIGTGNSIVELNTTLYGKEYSIVVTDANSNPVPAGESVQVAAPPINYRKGFWFVNAADEWQQQIEVECAAEDVNRNGQIDAGEDINGNTILDPGNVVSVAPIDASLPLDAGCEASGGSTGSSTTVQTNSLGIARVCLIYNQDQAAWAEIELTATAGVTGSESTAFEEVYLTGLAADYEDSDVEPPGVISPYGLATVCTDPN